ncbi:MAG TPA: ribosome small subunit-dependent GTPase A [Calditrichia bacterium]|nr:ribosome small subunit-dependent GTPase A [Calditrichia bacterium]HQV34617.1 ribosome small subunit-dependent GTPase A [Calditrichia bacterium]
MATLLTGKVLTATRATYNVALEEGTVRCTLRGRVVVEDSGIDAVKVGDDVEVSLLENEEGLIEKVLPRRSYLSRSIKSREYKEHIVAVNIDQLLIIAAARKPFFKSGLVDRFLVIAEKNGIHAAICINKMDLADPSHFQVFSDYYHGIGYPVIQTSAVTGAGLADLGGLLAGKVTAVMGQSGVGKSSLVNALNPHLAVRIGEVSERTQKGMHTTTHSELFPLGNGTFVVDTPGIRELGFWDIFKRELPAFFVDFAELAPECQFSDCTHIHEPGCQVIAGVSRGEIFAERYENYCNIYDSLKNASYET